MTNARRDLADELRRGHWPSPRAFRRDEPGAASASSLLFSYAAGASLSAAGATFVRASSATYFDVNGVMQTAGNNVARDGHYIGARRTVEMEGPATNLLIHSRGADFGDVSWVVSGTATKAVGTAVGIDGVAAGASTANVPAANDYVYQAVAGLAGQQVTISAYLKGTGANIGKVALLFIWDDVSGFQSSQEIILTANLTRYSATLTFNAGATTMRVGIGQVFQPATMATAVVFDAIQLEAGTYASSYIATGAATASRVADELSFPFPYAAQSVTMYCQFVCMYMPNIPGNDEGVVQLGDDVIKTLELYLLDGAHGNLGTITKDAAGTIVASGVPGVTFAPGDVIDARCVLDATWKTFPGWSANGNPENTGSLSASGNVFDRFNNDTLYVAKVPPGGTPHGFAAFTAVKVAAGVKSLADMIAAV